MEGGRRGLRGGTGLLPSGLIRAELSRTRTPNLCKTTGRESAFKSFFYPVCQSGRTGGACGLISPLSSEKTLNLSISLCLGQETKGVKGNPNNNNTHCPRLKLLDSPGDTETRQKTRACLFASSGPLSEEAPRIHLHANRPGQIPSG